MTRPHRRPDPLRPIPKRQAPPVYRPQQSLPILPKFYQGPRLPVAGPPPVYRPGAVPPTAAPIARPHTIQRSLIADYRAHRDQYNAGLTVAYQQAAAARLAEARRISQMATQVVTAHPPDDEYGVEDVYVYIERVRNHLEAAGFNDKETEVQGIRVALADHRAARQEAARRAAVERVQSLATLAAFETAAETHGQQIVRNVKRHVFAAEMNENDNPTGLHAYNNGALPRNVTVMLTIGDVNQVHLIVWRSTESGTKCKWSTMFPKNMPNGMVCWYLLNARDGANYRIGNRPLVPPFVWQAINIGQSGATNFPEYPGGEPAVRRDIAAAAGANYRTAMQSGVTRRYLTSGGIEYTIAN